MRATTMLFVRFRRASEAHQCGACGAMQAELVVLRRKFTQTGLWLERAVASSTARCALHTAAKVMELRK